jgi:chloride channel protein, CIC family
MLLLLHQIEVPRRLRAFARAHESSLILLAAAVGLLAGLLVVLMGLGVDLLHRLLFGIAPGQRLSASLDIDPRLAFGVPCLGGLAFGILSAFVARRRRRREIDPIEANALHGGRMSLVGSLLVAGETVLSSGVGASVGLEAGYTQLGGGIASTLGRAFHLRRGDLRVLVGCGTAAAIAGAFAAPLAGAFYAFELIIGGYSTANLAPVGIAALIGYLATRAFAPAQLGIVAAQTSTVVAHDLVVAGVLGLLAALFGIALMRGVALCETAFVRLRVPAFARPAIGGAIVGLCALVTPQVMSSGHGALHLAGVLDLPLQAVATMFVLKAVASMVSLGSGFRGGLFFASLLIGALGGQLFASGLTMLGSAYYFDPNAYALVGMSALSASVIGGPLTMIFIALETTGNLWLTAAVLVAVIISAQLTREVFGYSFATWRFHLRGESIRSAADVGWIRDLTVGKMMTQNAPTVAADTTVALFRQRFPLGSNAYAVALDEQGRYAGLVAIADAHAPEVPDGKTVHDLLHHRDRMLLPTVNVKQAVETFDQTEAEALAVVDSYLDRRVIGLLTEAYALRRYSAELEGRQRELLGEG